MERDERNDSVCNKLSMEELKKKIQQRMPNKVSQDSQDFSLWNHGFNTAMKLVLQWLE